MHKRESTKLITDVGTEDAQQVLSCEPIMYFGLCGTYKLNPGHRIFSMGRKQSEPMEGVSLPVLGVSVGLQTNTSQNVNTSAETFWDRLSTSIPVLLYRIQVLFLEPPRYDVLNAPNFCFSSRSICRSVSGEIYQE